MHELEKFRCFIGLRLPPVSKHINLLKEFTKFNVKIKIVDIKNYHFTLHFFGDLSPAQIEQIDEKLSEFHFNPFELELHGAGIIPRKNLKKVRVLYVGTLEGTNLLIKLANDVRRIISKAGFIVDKRPFLPHLTVARIRYGKDTDKVANKWLELENKPFQIVKCDNFSLIRSILTPKGPKYKDIKVYK